MLPSICLFHYKCLMYELQQMFDVPMLLSICLFHTLTNVWCTNTPEYLPVSHVDKCLMYQCSRVSACFTRWQMFDVPMLPSICLFHTLTNVWCTNAPEYLPVSHVDKLTNVWCTNAPEYLPSICLFHTLTNVWCTNAPEYLPVSHVDKCLMYQCSRVSACFTRWQMFDVCTNAPEYLPVSHVDKCLMYQCSWVSACFTRWQMFDVPMLLSISRVSACFTRWQMFDVPMLPSICLFHTLTNVWCTNAPEYLPVSHVDKCLMYQCSWVSACFTRWQMFDVPMLLSICLFHTLTNVWFTNAPEYPCFTRWQMFDVPMLLSICLFHTLTNVWCTNRVSACFTRVWCTNAPEYLPVSHVDKCLMYQCSRVSACFTRTNVWCTNAPEYLPFHTLTNVWCTNAPEYLPVSHVQMFDVPMLPSACFTRWQMFDVPMLPSICLFHMSLMYQCSECLFHTLTNVWCTNAPEYLPVSHVDKCLMYQCSRVSACFKVDKCLMYQCSRVSACFTRWQMFDVPMLPSICLFHTLTNVWCTNAPEYLPVSHVDKCLMYQCSRVSACFTRWQMFDVPMLPSICLFHWQMFDVPMLPSICLFHTLTNVWCTNAHDTLTNMYQCSRVSACFTRWQMFDVPMPRVSACFTRWQMFDVPMLPSICLFHTLTVWCTNAPEYPVSHVDKCLMYQCSRVSACFTRWHAAACFVFSLLAFMK